MRRRSERAFTRLENDERRRRLLELGAGLFTEHSYDEVSMARIARAAGISKALLYHYFPSKRDYFVATLAGGAEELRAAIEPDASLPESEALAGAVRAYVGWIDAHARAYEKLLASAGAVPEVRELVEEVRAATAERILAGLGRDDDPRARTVVHGWLWFADGACLDWIAHRDLSADEIADLLLGTLGGALAAAGVALQGST